LEAKIFKGSKQCVDHQEVEVVFKEAKTQALLYFKEKAVGE
jgi:hypothetical protein